MFSTNKKNRKKRLWRSYVSFSRNKYRKSALNYLWGDVRGQQEGKRWLHLPVAVLVGELGAATPGLFSHLPPHLHHTLLYHIPHPLPALRIGLELLLDHCLQLWRWIQTDKPEIHKQMRTIEYAHCYFGGQLLGTSQQSWHLSYLSYDLNDVWIKI